ncbi:MAG: hypothetical protein AAFR44_02070, partial [Pseudomonadota bacterium]
PINAPIEAVLGAVVFGASVGIFFGYLPAKRAAALDPIVALDGERRRCDAEAQKRNGNALQDAP